MFAFVNPPWQCPKPAAALREFRLPAKSAFFASAGEALKKEKKALSAQAHTGGSGWPQAKPSPSVSVSVSISISFSFSFSFSFSVCFRFVFGLFSVCFRFVFGSFSVCFRFAYRLAACLSPALHFPYKFRSIGLFDIGCRGRRPRRPGGKMFRF